MRQPRKKNYVDSSPPRRKIHWNDDDLSPPRRQHKYNDDPSLTRCRDRSSYSHRQQPPPSSTHRRQPKEEPSSSSSTYRRPKPDSSPPPSQSAKSERRRQAEHKEQIAERYTQWGRGLAQVRQTEEAVKDYLDQAEKPLARYRDDTDLDAMLKQKEREGK
jgi:pre-mRNA-splicing factor CWC26